MPATATPSAQPVQVYQAAYPSYEAMLNRYAYRVDAEKTFIDKILGRQDSNRLQQLMQSQEIDREDIAELTFLIASINSKLVNFNDWDRYLLGKFYAWIDDFGTLCQEIINYETDCNNKNVGLIREDVGEQLKFILDRVKKHNLHNYKFLVGVFLYLSNSTLSISGVGFDTLTTSKFEYSYPYEGLSMAPQPEQKSVFSFFMKGRR
jgi:hypothetical protein